MSFRSSSSRTLVAVLAATTILGGGAFAADQSAAPATTAPSGHGAVVKDFHKLSADGARAYQDLTLARLAIFDGRTGEAKTYVDQADDRFNKAKGDESVFTQAEATMRTNVMKGERSAAAGNTEKASSSNTKGPDASGNDVDKPVAWLPVDGTVIIDEDYTAQPAKAKAVADANKSLSTGDQKGAMEKLKLAEVETAVSLAVVPLQQTISDVDQARQMIDAGKYYEGSQKLKAVQDATVFTIADMPGMAAKVGAGTSHGTDKAPTPTH